MTSRRTPENQMLYSSLVRMVRAVDPTFDTEKIDRRLEPDEAKRQLRERYGVYIGRKVDSERSSHMKEYRDHLHDRGVRHPRMQNFLMRLDKPPREKDIDSIAYVLGARPHKSVKMDIKRKARHARTAAQYARNPNRYDVPGVDTPGSEFNVDWF